ncbi:glycosyltransferase family 39 protein [Hyphomicrobium sp. CS1GBMeth3]|uniref:ArnT family glycosyltransferase n=1 Tax=Hyphomicrobium sp. CS1GBMeth3 TaxID=1892845 RepID=UPI0015C562AA|nr:glycosyltransferase family 39 protein [Hyphomicrobium sp. CS1GBMeth3]
MNSDRRNLDRLGLAGLAVLGTLVVIAIMFLPAFPIDETRYLTVAWEMRQAGNWSLPTLNFEPYSHKPPLLFWLINASWSVFGLAVWPARLVGAAATGLVIFFTHRLDRLLAPAPAPGPAASALMLLGLPLFLALGLSIMFDMLLTATVSGAMLALWFAGRSGGWKAFVAYGVAVGLGLLAKGPVVLLFTVPAAVLARLWVDPQQRAGWPLRIAASLGIGVLLGLVWALRAASIGGPEFAEMLFWQQSAGRIASSFAHARPFWFYVPVVLLFFLPLLVWRPAWLGLRMSFKIGGSARNFLLSWIVPALLGLSLISGKQIHYLLPLLPAIALLVSLGLRRVAPTNADRFTWLALGTALLMLLAALAMDCGRFLPADSGFASIAAQLDLPLVFLTGVLAIGAIAISRGSTHRMLLGLAAANVIVLASLTIQSRVIVAKSFDLQPLADVVLTLRDRPIAVAQRTRGELGFLARLERSLVYVPEEDLPSWLSQHPDGVAIVRERADRANAMLTKGTLLYRQDYRLSEVIQVISAR